MYIESNKNPLNKRVGDCVIRAISTTENTDWDDTFLDLMLKSFEMKDIPSSNYVWSAFLKDLGYSRYVIPNTCPNCYTIRDFANENPVGTFILATGTHVVAVVDGNYIDTWDSGDEIPIYYFEKER